MRTVFWAIALIIAVVFSQETGYTEGYVGGSTNITPTESSYGVLGEYEKGFGKWQLETDGQIQKGLQVTGLANISIQRNFGDLAMTPYTEIVFSPEGRQQDFGFRCLGRRIIPKC